MAPERQTACGSPQDWIRLTTAARFGSSDAALAHRTRSSPQYWTSRVKMGESPLEDVLDWLANNGVVGVVIAKLGSDELGLLIISAEVEIGEFNASKVKKPAITRTANGGRR